MDGIIAADSPWARLPEGLHLKQRGWLQGMRYSVDIADLAMRRLMLGLFTLAPPGVKQVVLVEHSELIAAIVADAWTFVDAVYRLKRFMFDRPLPWPAGDPKPPTPEENKFSGKRFRAAIGGVKEIRDGFQHLDNNAPKIADDGDAVWGDLA